MDEWLTSQLGTLSNTPPPPKEPQHHFNGRLSVSQSWSGCFGENKSLAPVGIQTPDHPAHSTFARPTALPLSFSEHRVTPNKTNVTTFN